MELHYNVTGEKRKELVGVISELLKMKAVYMKMPTCAYVIDNITVEKDGTVVWNESTDQDTIEAVIIALAAAGFTAEKEEQPQEEESTGGAIQMPLSRFTEGQLQNLYNLVAAKGNLIKKAIGAEELPINIIENRLDFPWFPKYESPDEVKAYMHLVTALCDMARNQKRINAKEAEVVNEKYAFRCFLLRLGFIGEEYKMERKILLRNLSGSAAFRDGAKKQEVEA